VQLLILEDLNLQPHCPEWSPDGNHIAYISWLDSDFEIYITDVDGNNITNLTDNEGWDTNPNWSPCQSKSEKFQFLL
jgi:Tol biopolymer transport system component